MKLSSDRNLIMVVLYMVRQEESCTMIMPWSVPNFPGIQFMYGRNRTTFIRSMEKIISTVCCENKLIFYEPDCRMGFNLKTK